MKQPFDAVGKNAVFALLGRVGLHDANASERFGEPAGNLRGDFSPVAEQRAQPFERRGHADGKRGEHDDADGGEPPIQIEEHAQRQHRRDESPGHLHQSRADEIADAVCVVHDARDQDARLRGIEISNRQPRDVRLHAAAHVGNGLLRGHAQHLGQGKRRGGVNQRGRAHRQRQRHEQVAATMADHFVDEVLG